MYFNPRTHVGCDLVLIAYDAVLVISIHAPTWGATESCMVAIRKPLDFNPRTHVGCDSECKPRCQPNGYFNPRTHVGCDTIILRVMKTLYNFNPRTHVGCDDKVGYVDSD